MTTSTMETAVKMARAWAITKANDEDGDDDDNDNDGEAMIIRI